LAPPPDGGADPGHGEALLADGWTATAAGGPGELGIVAPEPPAGAGLHELGVLDLIRAYRDGVTSPGEMVDLLQARIRDERLAPETVLSLIDAADAVAHSGARIAAGTARPLEGIPFAVKDIIDVAGSPVTCGSRLTGDRIAQRDAEVVARLRAAGAIPIAMTATTEFACGGADNPRYGRVRNPWNAERWSGGSSAGSGAGLAARLFPFALGSDTGGSVRIPSAWCGTTGLKPTHGLVPRTGVASLSWTLDHVGPMTRSAADIAAVLPSMAGPDGVDPLQVPGLDAVPPRDSLRGLRVGVARGWFTEVATPGVVAAFDDSVEVLRSLGATTVPVDLGDLRRTHQEAYLIMYCELASLQEASDDRVALMDPGLAERYQRGLFSSAVDYLRALRRRPEVQRPS
jgi:aspartyl-tRNA(Asn)/glutamyl-tRNA(Gln) amidotransferase subunit A